MKKIIRLLIIILVSFFAGLSPVFTAGSSCPVDQKGNLVDNYIKNIRTLSQNITREATTQSQDPKNRDTIGGKVGIDSDRIRKMWTDISTWNGYFNYFEYYVTFPLSNEIPQQMQRDHRKLEREVRLLKNFLEQIAKTGHADIQLENICGTINNCNLDNKTAFEATSILIKEVSRYLDLFRATIMANDTNTHKYIYFIDTDVDFYKKDLSTRYGPGAIEPCSNEEGGFMEQIKTAISNITTNNKAAKRGIKDWEDAWAIINNTTTETEYESYQRELLRQELSRQGISGSQQENILNNLDRYNKTNSHSKDNNFFTNTFDGIGESIRKQWGHFKENLGDMMPEKDETTTLGEVKESISNIAGKDAQNQITQNIRKEIERVYQTELNFAAIEDISTKQTEAKIIDLHFSIMRSSEILKATKRDAETMCDRTDQGSGNCKTNN